MNMNSEFNYVFISPSRDPSVCQETPLLSKDVTLLLWGPHIKTHLSSKACVFGWKISKIFVYPVTNL